MRIARFSARLALVALLASLAALSLAGRAGARAAGVARFEARQIGRIEYDGTDLLRTGFGSKRVGPFDAMPPGFPDGFYDDEFCATRARKSEWTSSRAYFAKAELADKFEFKLNGAAFAPNPGEVTMRYRGALEGVKDRNLRQLTLDMGRISDISPAAFAGCDKLETVCFKGDDRAARQNPDLTGGRIISEYFDSDRIEIDKLQPISSSKLRFADRALRGLRNASLTELVIPANEISSIRSGALEACPSLSDIYLQFAPSPAFFEPGWSGGRDIRVHSGPDALSRAPTDPAELDIRGALVEVADETVETLVLPPDAIASIRAGAFDGCPKLKRICYQGSDWSALPKPRDWSGGRDIAALSASDRISVALFPPTDASLYRLNESKKLIWADPSLRSLVFPEGSISGIARDALRGCAKLAFVCFQGSDFAKLDLEPYWSDASGSDPIVLGPRDSVPLDAPRPASPDDLLLTDSGYLEGLKDPGLETLVLAPGSVSGISTNAFKDCPSLRIVCYAGDWRSLPKAPNWSGGRELIALSLCDTVAVSELDPTPAESLTLGAVKNPGSYVADFSYAGSVAQVAIKVSRRAIKANVLINGRVGSFDSPVVVKESERGKIALNYDYVGAAPGDARYEEQNGVVVRALRPGALTHLAFVARLPDAVDRVCAVVAQGAMSDLYDFEYPASHILIERETVSSLDCAESSVRVSVNEGRYSSIDSLRFADIGISPASPEFLDAKTRAERVYGASGLFDRNKIAACYRLDVVGRDGARSENAPGTVKIESARKLGAASGCKAVALYNSGKTDILDASYSESDSSIAFKADDMGCFIILTPVERMTASSYVAIGLASFAVVLLAMLLAVLFRRKY